MHFSTISAGSAAMLRLTLQLISIGIAAGDITEPVDCWLQLIVAKDVVPPTSGGQCPYTIQCNATEAPSKASEHNCYPVTWLPGCDPTWFTTTFRLHEPTRVFQQGGLFCDVDKSAYAPPGFPSNIGCNVFEVQGQEVKFRSDCEEIRY
jgi:hypothetical protein